MKVLKSSFIQSVSLVKSEGEATSLFKPIKSAAQDVLKEALCREPNGNLFLIWTKQEFIPVWFKERTQSVHGDGLRVSLTLKPKYVPQSLWANISSQSPVISDITKRAALDRVRTRLHRGAAAERQVRLDSTHTGVINNNCSLRLWSSNLGFGALNGMFRTPNRQQTLGLTAASVWRMGSLRRGGGTGTSLHSSEHRISGYQGWTSEDLVLFALLKP